MYDAVLADIQYHAQLAYEDRDKAVALAIRMNDKAEGSRAKSSEGKLKQARKRYDEVTRMFDRLYEDSLSGRISNDNFTRLVDKYQAEQAQLLEQIDALERAGHPAERRTVGRPDGGVRRYPGIDRRKPQSPCGAH